jgi:hypothetical protein
MMPSWTDETGFSWFGVLECKRCLGRYRAATDKSGDSNVPVHRCLGGELWTSVSEYGTHYVPVPYRGPKTKVAKPV